ncbi:MAG: peptidylprolyl isomerase [Alphaproteobacteria bacterium]
MRFFLILISFLIMTLPTRAESIAAVVNADAISMSDLEARTDMIVISSGLPNSKEVREKLTPQILSALIEEQLKMQEAARLNVKVADEEINSGFAELAAQNNIPIDQFMLMIEKSGIDLETMKNQIRAQIGWGKVIQQEMRQKITVTDTDIDDYIQRIKSNKGKTEYHLAEILLPVDTERPEGEALKVADRLVQEITKGARFSKVAQQFSAAPGATQGGDRGWVQQGLLAPELDSVIQTTAKGMVTPPIRAVDGIHIFLVRDVRVITDESIPPRDKIYNMLGIQRLERLQARALLDLKSTAFIQTRV